jgi:hypothetical protein
VSVSLIIAVKTAEDTSKLDHRASH